MKKFLVLYMAPNAAMAEWMQKPAEERKAAEEKMQGEWQAWMKEHASVFADMGGGAGKTKRVTKDGTADAKNDIMLYSLVQGESEEGITKLFESHPHFGIPGASIEIMEVRPMDGSM
jgi:hypothetical protein